MNILIELAFFAPAIGKRSPFVTVSYTNQKKPIGLIS